MDVRVTPIPRFVSGTNYKPGTPAGYQQNRLTSAASGSSGIKHDVLITRTGQLNKPQTFNSSKRPGVDNNLLLISRKEPGKPRAFLNVTPNLNQSVNQTPAIAGNKKVMLYQQIERNNLLSNNSELVNRFNYKV